MHLNDSKRLSMSAGLSPSALCCWRKCLPRGLQLHICLERARSRLGEHTLPGGLSSELVSVSAKRACPNSFQLEAIESLAHKAVVLLKGLPGAGSVLQALFPPLLVASQSRQLWAQVEAGRRRPGSGNRDHIPWDSNYRRHTPLLRWASAGTARKA